MNNNFLSQADRISHFASKLDAKQEYKKALKNYKFALKIYTKCKESSRVVTCFNNIGLVYLNLKKYSKALKAFKSGLNICHTLDNTPDNMLAYALFLIHIGDVYKEQGKYSNTLKYYNKALPILENNDWSKKEGRYVLEHISDFMKSVKNY